MSTDLERECQAVDALLTYLCLEPDRYRTEGGSVNLPKIRAELADRAARAEPVAWRFAKSYWTLLDSVPQDLRPHVEPLYAEPPAARAEPPAVPEGWQPIETAPKDGTSVLGFLPHRKGYIARRNITPVYWSKWDGGTWADSNSTHPIGDPVTHWVPLPAAPEPKP